MAHARNQSSNNATVGAPAAVDALPKAQKALAALFAVSLGLGLLAVTGFAQSAHDVAHDARHAFSVPCH